MVGVTGFEHATSSSRTKRSTKLSHTPVSADYYSKLSFKIPQVFLKNRLCVRFYGRILDMEQTCIMESPIGNLRIVRDETDIAEISFTDEGVLESQDDLLSLAVQELTEYFMGKRKDFDLPLHLKGTEYQMKIWSMLLEIPYGETRTYKCIAEKMGNVKAARAVGGAVHRNPIAIIVPCHRVIGSDAGLTGYAYGIGIKEQLLELERGEAEWLNGEEEN